MTEGKFYGKYRGKVANNIDPLFLGRIQATVPAVPGLMLNWAMPCTPYAGSGVGFYAIPPIGANVWVEFEGGDPNYPIWSGCFWETLEVPEPPVTPFKKVFKTDTITMILDDTPGAGGFKLLANPPSVVNPLTMVWDSAGIKITTPFGSISMTPAAITVEQPQSKMTMTAASIAQEILTTSVKMDPQQIAMQSATIASTALQEVSATAPQVTLTAAATASMKAGANLSLEAGLAASMQAGGTVAIKAAGSAQVQAVGDVSIQSAAALTMVAGLAASMTAGATIAFAATGNVSITAVTTAVTSVVQVTGALLINGLPPVLVPV